MLARFVKLLLGVALSVTGFIQFGANPPVGLAIAFIGGAMVLEAAFQPE